MGARKTTQIPALYMPAAGGNHALVHWLTTQFYVQGWFRVQDLGFADEG